MKGTNQMQSAGLILLLIAAFFSLALAALSEFDDAPQSADPVEVIAEQGVGDGHRASEVPLGSVAGIAADAAGAIFFVDPVFARVRRVDPGGIIDTVFNGYKLNVPSGPRAVAVDQRSGAVYITDDVGNRVWTVRDGAIRILAGTGEYGFSGDGGPATNAQFRLPKGIAVAADGTIYIADMGNHRIRAVAPDGTIRTAAGGLPPETEWAEADRVEGLFLPLLVAAGPDGSLYVVDRLGQRLQRLLPDGTAQPLSRGGGPSSIAVTAAGDLILADASGLHLLHDGVWSRLAEGAALTVATSLGADVIAYDWKTHRLLRLHDGADGELVAGNGTMGAFGDGGPANGATFSCYDLVVGLQGEIAFSDTLNRRVAVIRDGQIRTLASLDGALGLGLDAHGIVYVADQGSHRVLAIDPEGNLKSIAGNGVAGFGGDGGLATEASLSHPVDVGVAADGEILISDGENRRVRHVDAKGVITTLATFETPTGALFLHPDGHVVVSLGGGRELVELEPNGTPAAVKLTESTRSTDARSRREALGFAPDGALLFVSGGQLYGARGVEPARVLPLGPSSSLAEPIRMALANNGDLVWCDERQRILRVRGATVQAALTALARR